MLLELNFFIFILENNRKNKYQFLVLECISFITRRVQNTHSSGFITLQPKTLHKTWQDLEHIDSTDGFRRLKYSTKSTSK